MNLETESNKFLVSVTLNFRTPQEARLFYHVLNSNNVGGLILKDKSFNKKECSTDFAEYFQLSDWELEKVEEAITNTGCTL